MLDIGMDEPKLLLSRTKSTARVIPHYVSLNNQVLKVKDVLLLRKLATCHATTQRLEVSATHWQFMVFHQYLLEMSS